MSLNKSLIAELQNEAANTRKMLERVPVDKNDWKPHKKSMELGRLARHVADLPSWITVTLTTDELDFAKFEYKPHMAATNEELVSILDTMVQKATETLENASEEEFNKMWTLRNGDHVILTLPKKAVLRSFALSHMYHHRGQLSVYLRLLDVPVPGMYGPSADDMPSPAEMEPAGEMAAAN